MRASLLIASTLWCRRFLAASIQPLSEPLPVFQPDEHDLGCLHEQRPQVAIASPRERPKDGEVAGGICFVTRPSQATKSRPLASADRRHHGVGDDQPGARHAHRSSGASDPEMLRQTNGIVAAHDLTAYALMNKTG